MTSQLPSIAQDHPKKTAQALFGNGQHPFFKPAAPALRTAHFADSHPEKETGEVGEIRLPVQKTPGPAIQRQNDESPSPDVDSGITENGDAVPDEEPEAGDIPNLSIDVPLPMTLRVNGVMYTSPTFLLEGPNGQIVDLAPYTGRGGFDFPLAALESLGIPVLSFYHFHYGRAREFLGRHFESAYALSGGTSFIRNALHYGYITADDVTLFGAPSSFNLEHYGGIPHLNIVANPMDIGTMINVSYFNAPLFEGHNNPAVLFSINSPFDQNPFEAFTNLGGAFYHALSGDLYHLPGVTHNYPRFQREPVEAIGSPYSRTQISRKPETETPPRTAPATVEHRIQAKTGKGDPLPDQHRVFMEQYIGADFSDVRIHTDADAVQLNRSLGAQAFTHGKDIFFNRGKFSPGTSEGKQLLAHELTHVVQQTAGSGPQLQREVIDMEPITIRSGLRPVGEAISNLESLRDAGRSPDDVEVTRDDDTIARNAPDPNLRLPFSDGAWDANAIITAMGQYDTIPETDSDALRCVQAVAMVSRVINGPQAVSGFLQATILEGMISRRLGRREQTAIEVLRHVINRIESRRATYGDLLWAQEALHDLFYNDVEGTPEDDILDRMGPTFDLNTNIEPMNVWLNSPAEVIAEINRLQPGEQYLLNTWKVVFNVVFDELSERGIDVAEGSGTVVSVNGRRVRVRRIATDTRPPHTAIDPIVRDRKLGHQLLVFKDGSTGQLRLYEPEVTTSGRHLEDLAADGSNFERYFRDHPDLGIYNYMQILGKITPNSLQPPDWDNL